MKKLAFGLRVLLLFVLPLCVACNSIGTSKFDGLISEKSDIFAGIHSIENKTDSTVTLKWSTHKNALEYLLYDVSSGTPVLIQTISDPMTNSLTLTDLTPDLTYKYRLRITHNQGKIDDNTNDFIIVMNHEPAIPSNPTFHTSTSSPGRNNSPVFTVRGVKTGDVVSLYKDDATCSSMAVASGAVGDGQTSIDLQVSVDGTNTFYADTANSLSHHSGCSGGLTYELIRLNCPSEYIEVLSNSSVGVNYDFCVAKYEMRNVSGLATSQATGNLWVSITPTNAWNACLDLNSEVLNSDRVADTNSDGTFSLISNAEWMTIARSIEDEATNWIGGVLNRGWTTSTNGGDSWNHSAIAPQTNSNCLYSNAGNTCSSSGLHKFKRTHTLKNGEEVWDLSGNVFEWVDWSSIDDSFTLGPQKCSSHWAEVNAFNPNSCTEGPVMSTDDYMPLVSENTSAQNIGRVIGGNGGATYRGSYYNLGNTGGLFTFSFTSTLSSQGAHIGFRCVWRPATSQ